MTKTYGSVVRSLISLMLVGVIVFVASPLMSGGKQQTAKAESRATNWLLNGSFENLTGGVPDNWTIENSRVNLGVTVLGGCTSVDTVDYAGIWTRSPLYGAVPVFPFPNDGSALKPTNDNDPSFSGTFTSSVNNTVDVVSPALAPTDGTNTWYMRIASGSGVGGHVVHGGSLVSDEFKAVAGQVITMDWFSAAGGDDFAVLGYLLNTATCTQTTVFETTGTTISSWQNAFVTIPATADTYRFVFVSGTFDRTGGTVSGSKFWLDNISQGAPQTITMDLSDVTGKNFYAGGGTSAPFSIAGQATTPSGLPITYASTTAGVCTVSGTTVTITGTGTCTLRASQPGGTDGTGKLWASAPSVTSSFTVSNTAPTPQTITFGPLSDKSQSAAPFSVSATTSSGGTVTFTSSTAAVCTVTSAGVVTLKTAGTCTITANAAVQTVGGTLYAAATPVPQSFSVNAAQTITFNPTDKLYTSPDYNLTATTTSGLPLTYTSSTPSICMVTSSGTVNLLDVGTCTITASQAGGTSGGTTYGAASVTKSFEATPAVQTVNFPTLPEWRLYEGDEITPAATASSGLPVTYTTTTPLVCSIVGGKIKVVGLGKCTVKAVAAAGAIGGTKYGESAEVTREFFITDTKPTATFTPTNTRTPTPTQTPTPIPFLLKKGAIGASFVLGLLQNDTLVTWGMNREFQANIPPCCGSGIDDVAVGTNFALALKGGKVYGWGANSLKQITIPTTASKDITAIAAGGSFGLALNKKGGVVYWGSAKSPVKKMPKTLKKGIKLIAGGTDHALAVTTKNKIIGWGNGKQGQTKPPAKQVAKKVITQISAGLDHSLALLSTGTVVAWGNNSKGQTKPPVTAVDIKFISAGNKFSVALSNAGKVYAWGDNSVNQTNIPTEYTDIYTVAASYANTILGLRNGRIIVLGDQTNDVGVSRTPTKTATPTP